MNCEFVKELEKFVIIPHVVNKKWDGEHWVTLTHLYVRINGKLLVIPSGFVTNFGSIPEALRALLDRMGHSLRAFVVHDWLYSILFGVEYKYWNDLSKSECDDILFELSRLDGESWFEAQAIEIGLDFGGWTCFKESKPIIAEVNKDIISYICRCNGGEFIPN